MNKIGLALLFLSITSLIACKQNNANVESSGATTDTTRFFEVAQYIKSQIDEVNRTPYFIYKVDSSDNKRDSTPITTKVFNQVASQFLKPDINNQEFKKQFRESIFHDETTKSFTINYTTTSKDFELQSVDVLLEEDGQTVKRVFLRKFFNYPDSSAIEQLSWKPNQSFQINRVVQLPDNKEHLYQTIVVWNEKS